MNIKRITSADFVLGKILIAGKAVLDILVMLIRNPSKRSVWLARLILRAKPKYTMVTNAHLMNLYDLVQEANALNLPGDIVECGVWNGGSAAIMAVACQEDKTRFEQRKLWLFDSFQGLPRPGEHDGKTARDSFFEGQCKGSIEKVQEIFDRLGVSLEKVNIVPGWFDSTLGAASVDRIAALHIDADWYDSVKVVLETLYDRVVPGGFIVLDDYGYWEGCSKAVADYLKEREIKGVVIKKVDRFGAYFQKPITTT